MGSDWGSAVRILCIRLDSLGDVLMTEPAIRALKTANPRREITLLTSTAGAQAASLIPEIDAIIVYEAPWMKATALRDDSRTDLEMVRRLQQLKFDGAVIFTVYSQSALPAALMCRLAEIPLSLGCCHENPYQLLTDWIPETEPGRDIRHEARRQLDLVAAIGCELDDERMQIRIPGDCDRSVKRKLASTGLEGKNWIVLHPGASAPSRRYPAGSYAAVVRELYIDHRISTVFTGLRQELDLIESIQQQADVPSYSLAGELSLAELAALLHLAPILISNNTGPVHVAASVGTPVVDLYALTNPQHTPWGVPNRVLNHDVPCKYCYKSVCPEGHHNCLRKVSPQRVVDAVRELLGSTSGFPARSRKPRRDFA